MAHRSPLITVMISAAGKAARALRRDFGEVENLQVSKKDRRILCQSRSEGREGSV